MTGWSLKWRILAEIIVLVVVVATVGSVFHVAGTVLIGIVAVFVGGIRAWHLSSQFSRITEDVLRTASIDRSHRIIPEGPAELARMARAVNRLSDRLVAAMADTEIERGRLRSILDTTSEGVLLVDAEGIVEFANPSALRLLGPEDDYAPGIRLISVNNHFDLNELASVPAQTGQVTEAKLEIRASNSVVQARATPFQDRDGRRKTVLLLTDITSIRNTETIRREFVSNASHELRTPIAAIRAAAETLEGRAGEDADARQNFLGRILEDTNRMELLVQEMLELSRLESGQTTLHIASANPAQFLSDVRERFIPMADKSQSTIIVDAADDLPDVAIDPIKFEQVLTNLITNAFNARPTGCRVVLTARDAGRNVLFEVSDNGPGIAPSHLAHVFERFYKVDSARSDGGTGLGLSIARHIVQAHRGDISVTSKLGVGTTFAVSVPRATVDTVT
jgi:two-component system phosphate regulon sensor histidine kinase PhoR